MRFEALADLEKEWPANTRVRFHLGASEIIGRLVLLESESVAPGASALAQVRLERPTVAARGDRFVIRRYSPSHTIGGGSVIEPVAAKRRRHGALDALEVRESGSLEARLLQLVEAEDSPVSTSRLAQVVGESQTVTQAALARLLEDHEIAMPLPDRWLALKKWHGALEIIEREVRGYADKYPSRFGYLKGELKSGLKVAMEGTLFDIAFHALEEEGRLEVRSQRVRPADSPWEPPAATRAALEKLEADLEATGMSVPDALVWQGKLGVGCRGGRHARPVPGAAGAREPGADLHLTPDEGPAREAGRSLREAGRAHHGRVQGAGRREPQVRRAPARALRPHGLDGARGGREEEGRARVG